MIQIVEIRKERTGECNSCLNPAKYELRVSHDTRNTNVVRFCNKCLNDLKLEIECT
jgi:hypothetical protein